MLRVVIDTSPLAIVTMDFSGNVRSWNRAAERMFGWLERRSSASPSPSCPKTTRPFSAATWTACKRGETIAGVERQRRRKDGTLDRRGSVERAATGRRGPRDRRHFGDRRHDRPQALGGAVPPGAEDGGRRPAGRRRGARLQQPAHRHRRLHADAARRPCSRTTPCAPRVEEIDRASASAAALTHQLLAFSRRQVAHAATCSTSTQLVAGLDKMLQRLIGEDVELVTLLAPELPSVEGGPRPDRAGDHEPGGQRPRRHADGGRLTIETATEVGGVRRAQPGRESAPAATSCSSVADTGAA